jgi:cytochrome c biogenesis protein CcmG, thiol:disulfide interchange protein DsbE
MRWLAVILLMLTLYTPFLVPDGARAAGRNPLKIGDPPPRIALKDLNGAPVRLPDDYRGKVVIIHFWAGGCSSCKEEMPAMETLYISYGRKGLVILAVNMGQRKETVKILVRGLGITYPVLLDSDREMAMKYGVVGVPRTYMVDRNGIIRYRIIGAASAEMLKKQVLSLL